MYLIDLPKDDLKWLQKGLNKKDIRQYCTIILVKDGKAYATNGHVLHRVETIEDQDGLYSYEGTKIDEEIRHPLSNNLDRLLSNYDFPCVLSIIPGNLQVLALDNTYGINKDYFNNAIGKAKHIKIESKEDLSSIKIEYDNRLSIIMGCKL